MVFLLKKRKALPFALAATGAFVLTALSFLYAEQTRVVPAQRLCGTTAAVEGVLAASPVPNQDGCALTLKNCAVNGKRTGLRITVYLRQPLAAEPGDTASCGAVRFGSAPQRGVYFYHRLSKGVVLTGSAETAVRKSAEKRGLGDRIVLLRERAGNTLDAALDAPADGIARALLLGQSDATGDALRTQLRAAGASHIFAVSGMHLSLWAGVLFLILQKRAKTKRWANLAASVFVVFYAALTGFSPSVVRAAIMLLCVFLGRIVRKRSDPLNSLGLAATLQLIFSPFLAGNVSFLLSFFATAAILLVFPLYARRTGRASTLRGRLRKSGLGLLNAVVLSLSVLFFTVPVSAVFFGSVSLASPVSSLLCVLPAEGVMLTGGAGLLLGFFPPAAALCFRLCGRCAGLLTLALKAASAFDFLQVSTSGAYIPVWYAATLLGVCALLLKKPLRRWLPAFLLGSAGAILIFGGILRLTQTHKVRLILPENGNCTSVCLTFGGGAYLIGTGETEKQARTTAQALTDEGIVRLDGLIVPDELPQQSGQLTYVAAQYRFRQLFTAVAGKKYFDAVKTYLNAKNFRIGLPEGYEYVNCGSAHAALLTGGQKVVFSFSPSAALSGDPALCGGDVLICRGAIPKDADPAAYGRIFVLTNKSADRLSLPPNAVPTGQTGGIELDL